MLLHAGVSDYCSVCFDKGVFVAALSEEFCRWSNFIVVQYRLCYDWFLLWLGLAARISSSLVEWKGKKVNKRSLLRSSTGQIWRTGRQYIRLKVSGSPARCLRCIGRCVNCFRNYAGRFINVSWNSCNLSLSKYSALFSKRVSLLFEKTYGFIQILHFFARV